MSKILDFYNGACHNGTGIYWYSIDRLHDEDLENIHDYIQWAFPLPERSGFNPDAPILTQEDCKVFKADASLPFKVLTVFIRMVQFYGFNIECDMITPLKIESDEAPLWIRRFNHNMLRITRILRSLRLLGLEEYSVIFYNALSKYKDLVGEDTFGYWTWAVKGPLLEIEL